MTKKVHTVESSDRNEFDRIINIMVNQGWELTGSNNIPGKYSQTLSYHYNDDDELEFYENGFVEFHRIYKSDTEESKIYFKNGNLNWNENWKDGDRHGKWKEYYDNGNIKVDTNFSNGIIKGHIEIKTKDGDIILSSHNIDMDGIVSKTNGNEEDVEETIIENYGDITIYSEGNRYTGELHVFDFDYDEHDEVIEETVHEFFEKLLNRRKENSNIGLIFMNDVSHQYGKYWEETDGSFI